MLWLATTLKLVAEVALLALLGQWLLGWLIGAARERNFAWQVLAAVTRPPLRLAQALLRARAPGRGVQALAFGGLLAGWLVATAWKIQIVRACVAAGEAACR
ncbi:MAG: hypothetical protein ACOZJX_01240 [Pseudomonadota bacterium]